MAPRTEKEPFDGATLSPKLKPRGEPDPAALALPIGKPGGSVARVYKHAAGKSSTYAPEVVDMIYHMSRQGVFDDDQVGAFVAEKLSAERRFDRTIPDTTWDQLVFLSANLTRLVIDPYREKCNARVVIGPDRDRPLVLDSPIVFGQVDFARCPPGLLAHVCRAAADANLAVTVDPAWPIDSSAAPRRIVEIDVAAEPPDLSGAAAVQISAPRAGGLERGAPAPLVEAIRAATGSAIPVGLCVPAAGAANVIDGSIDLGFDFYVPDAQWTADERPDAAFPELAGPPLLDVLRVTIERLRHHRRENLVQVIYRGGIRGGADAGKALCLGATAVTLGLSAVVGMGFQITGIKDEPDLIAKISKPRDADAAATGVHNFAKSVVTEVTMLARACGKSSVTNMEPEDLRTLTVGVSAATGIPLAGRDVVFNPGDQRSEIRDQAPA